MPTWIAALATAAKIQHQPRHPLTVEWKRKRGHLYTEGYYSAIKMQSIICENMGGTGGHIDKEISQALTSKSCTSSQPHVDTKMLIS